MKTKGTSGCTEVALSAKNMVGDKLWHNREEKWRTLAGIRSCIAYPTGIVRWMSNAIVSFPAFFEVGFLSRRYLVVYEVVDEVGRINAFVDAESEFRLSQASRLQSIWWSGQVRESW